MLVLHCAFLLFATIKILFYYFQMITDHLKIPMIRIIFLSSYITYMMTHLYAYCYSAEKLMAEVKFMRVNSFNTIYTFITITFNTIYIC